METKKHIIGYYRQNQKLTPIWSESRVIYDNWFKRPFEALLIPLETMPISEGWVINTFSDCHIPQALETLMKNQQTWMTCQNQDATFFALMVAPQNNPSMTRTGVIVERVGDQVEPLSVEINGEPYLVELKGCGSPLGQFQGTHFREAAGSYKKGHARLTGALQAWEAEKEDHNINQLQHLFPNDGYPIKSLGYCRYTHNNLTLGMVIRLVPSCIRPSYENPGLDPIMNNPKLRAYTQCGELNAHFIQSGPHYFHHQNLNLSNMIYVDRDHYVLTDLSELQPFSGGPLTLEYPMLVMAEEFYYDQNEFTPEIGQAYLKGLQSKTKQTYPALPCPFRSEAYQALWNAKAHLYSPELCREFLANHTQFTDTKRVLEKYQHGYHYFFPESYQTLDLLEWIDKVLIPICDEKINRNTVYLNNPKEMWPVDQTPKGSYKDHELNQFLPLVALENKWVSPIDDHAELTARIDVITKIKNQAIAAVQQGKLSEPSYEEIVNKTIKGLETDLISFTNPMAIHTCINNENLKLIHERAGQ